jgi:RimJ/RimL family protein N-acetyltransferase
MSVQVKEDSVRVIPTDPTAPLLDENNKPIQHPVIGMGGINGLFIKNGLKYTDVRIVIDSKETRNGYGTEVLTEVATMGFGEYGAEMCSWRLWW